MIQSLSKYNSTFRKNIINKIYFNQQLVEIAQIDLSNGATVHIFDCPGIPRNAKIIEPFEEDLIKTIKGHIKSGYEVKCSSI